MSLFDDTVEKASRRLARLTSRRGVLSALGKLVVGGAVLPLLPIDRTYGKTDPHQADATKCDYWKYCAMDGQLCSCCGGTGMQCPPGTEASSVSWVGTCLNAHDGKNYLVSNDTIDGAEIYSYYFTPPKNNKGKVYVYVETTSGLTYLTEAKYDVTSTAAAAGTGKSILAR